MKFIANGYIKFTLIYFLAGLLWIMFFDELLRIVISFKTFEKLELYKDIGFIIVTSIVVFILVKRNRILERDYLKKIGTETKKSDYLSNISDNAIIIVDDLGSIIKSNTSAVEMFGLSHGDIITKKIEDLLPEYQLNEMESSKFIKSKLRLVKRGSDQDFECYFNNFKKNNVFLAEVELRCEREISPDTYIKIRDVSNIKRYQNQLIIKNKELEKRNSELRNVNILLKESTSRFKILFQNAPIAYQSLDINGNFVDINNTWMDILGYKREEIIGKHFTDFMSEESAKMMPLTFKEFKKSGEIDDQIFELVKKDGTLINASYRGRVGYNNDGSFKQTYCIFSDVTEQLEKDEALKKSYEKYKTVADFTYDWEYWLLPDESFEYVSPSCQKITGYSYEEFMKNPSLLNDIVIEEDKPGWHKHKESTRKELTKESEMIFRIKHKNGNIRWIGHYCCVVYNQEGKYLGRRGSNRDITGRIMAEKIILQERDLARNILKSTNAGIWDWNIPEHKLDVNVRWAEMIGYKLRELRPIDEKTAFKYMHPDDEKKVRLLIEKVFTKEVDYYDIDYRLKHKNGSWIWVNSRGKVIEWSEKKQPVRMIGTHLDITENKLSEKNAMNRIITAEEKERERIAKDLHDGVSPVLSAVKLYCQSLLDTREERLKQELVEKISGTVNESITSISEISNNISPHVLKNFGLTLAVENFVNRIMELKLIDISIDNSLEERVAENIEVNLYRITTELINNTIKYAKAKNISIKYFIDDSNIVMVYSDNGVGFTMSKIKGKNKGMGILNIRNRIELLDGQFTFTSKHNKGIKIEISIPLN